jgi:homoserine dehydrogenase
MKLILVGFGVVGQGFAEILMDKANDLQEKSDFSAQVVGVITGSKGTLYHPAGLDLSALLDATQAGSFEGYPESDGLKRNWDATEMITKGTADVVVEMSPTNLDTAEPALTYCQTALDNDKHLILANKGPVALAYNDLNTKATENNLHMRYEATVMAGTPTMMLAEDALAGCTISEARGILNGTTNYILTQMENGMDYADALAKAQELGYAETDPTGDVEGWDAAGKVLILSNALFGKSLTMQDLDVEGITKITAGDIKDAQANQQRYKLIASATPDGGSVKPIRLPITDPLASVGDATNAITLKTDLMGDITLIGAGAGKLETGYAILADLLAIDRQLG